MKKIVAIVVAIIVVAGGAYLIFHNSSDSSSSNSTRATSQNNAPAVNNAVVVTKTSSAVGQYLADPSGKALYTYNADTSGVSNCTGSCLAAWPAYVDKGSTTALPAGIGTITRKDTGQIQYTYNGMPLYYFVSDGSGKVTGDGVQNFSVAKPAAASSSSPSSPPSDMPAQSDSSAATPSYNY